MTPELYPICTLSEGRIFMMPKPASDTNEALSHDIAYYKSQGITKVISLLCEPEIEHLSMGEEGEICQQHQLKFANFQITDFEVPNPQALQAFNAQLKQDLAAGETLAIHCHGGRGRSSIVAITLMMEHGYDCEDARAIASQARGCAVPVNDIQLEFVRSYSPKSE